jgi:two-component system response regulator
MDNLQPLNEVEVLLVEDNPSDAELTMRALKKRNLANKLFHAKDGAEALDFLFAQGPFVHRRIENGPKVVLLDPSGRNDFVPRRQRSRYLLRQWC